MPDLVSAELGVGLLVFALILLGSALKLSTESKKQMSLAAQNLELARQALEAAKVSDKGAGAAEASLLSQDQARPRLPGKDSAKAGRPHAGNSQARPESTDNAKSAVSVTAYPVMLLLQAMEQIHDDEKAERLLEKALQALPDEIRCLGVQPQDLRACLILVHELIHSNPDDLPDFQKRLAGFGAEGKLLLSVSALSLMKEAHNKLDHDDEEDLKEYYPLLEAAIGAAVAANKA